MVWKYGRFGTLHGMITVGITARVLFEQKLEGGKEQYKDLYRHRKQHNFLRWEYIWNIQKTVNKPVWLHNSEQEGEKK